jgi:hypothetical protein
MYKINSPLTNAVGGVFAYKENFDKIKIDITEKLIKN